MTNTTNRGTVEFTDNGTEYNGGIRFRADFEDGTAITTNGEGSGLFFHNGRGDRNQTTGTGQYHAKTLADFRREVLKRYRN